VAVSRPGGRAALREPGADGDPGGRRPPTGSWPRYYDSLRVFSPAAYSSMPGMPFPGEPDRYPGRDEVADYLERYAAQLDVEIQVDTRVETIQQSGRAFVVLTADGRELHASGIVAASGSFSNPYRPSFPAGHSPASCRTSPTTATRRRTPGSEDRRRCGRLAAQVANELAPIATVTIATRHPVRLVPQRLSGQDVHFWFRETGSTHCRRSG
jgi:putative flavoprotein involved in K+ transport